MTITAAETEILEDIITNVGTDVAGHYLVSRHKLGYFYNHLNETNIIEDLARACAEMIHVGVDKMARNSMLSPCSNPETIEKLRNLLGQLPK